MEENKKFNVDEALKKLEEINRKLSSSDIPLDEAMNLYKEGAQLAAQCKEYLESVEKELIVVNQ